MAHATLSFEQVRKRNEEIIAYAKQHPEVTNTALGVKYGLSRESIRTICLRFSNRSDERVMVIPRLKPSSGC